MEQTPHLHMPTGEHITIRQRPESASSSFFEFEAVLPPRLPGPPAHWHLREHETFQVLEGTLHVRLGPRRFDLGAGQSVTVPPGTVHAFSNPTDSPVHIVTRESPAGPLEQQLRLLASSRRPPLLRLAAINSGPDMSFFLAAVPYRPQRWMWNTLAAVARVVDTVQALR